MSEAPKLKPCPFCGGEAEVSNYVIEADVRCLCGANIIRLHGTCDDTGLPAAIDAWNTRTDAITPQMAAKVLADLPPDELRPILSELANSTPQVVYWPSDFLQEFPEKELRNGSKMPPASQGAMFMANAASRFMAEGEEMTVHLGGICHGAENNGDWKVTIERLRTIAQEDKQ